MQIEKYFAELKRRVEVAYDVAEKARKKGLDPKSKVEIPLATSLAGRVIGLISTVYPQLNNQKAINRILELEKEHGKLDPAVCLQIAEEIAKEKFCKFQDLQESMDAGIRTGIAYITLGVVSSAIEGYTGFKLRKTKENKEYMDVYYSGPIRSAGGTAAAFSLVIADYLREAMGYAKYDPTETEVKRYVTELYDYHERVTNLQYLPTEQEIEFMTSKMPLQVSGDPSSQREVSNHKDLERMETNLIRSGVCLTLGEGLAQKAPKILKMIRKLKEKGFKLSGWDFMEDFCKLQKKLRDVKSDKKAAAVYIQDLVAGRPVLSHPSESGGFRLRYGRARNTGYSALAINPSTMSVLGDFIAIGSQLKIERPTKGCAVVSCDTIDGPIVKLKNGDLKIIKKYEEGKKLYPEIEEIVYLGDLLVPYGDFLDRNHVLMPAGYSEQEWMQDLKENINLNEYIIEDLNPYNIDFSQAISLSEKFKIPLYPKFIFYWSQIKKQDFLELLSWLEKARIREKIILPYSKLQKEDFSQAKRALELLGIEHKVSLENVILEKEISEALLVNLGLSESLISNENFSLKQKIEELKKKIKGEEVLEIINFLSKYKIEDKAGTFIGARMGRPEKAKLRKLVGSPNVLFPVGKEGGRLRSFQEACSVGSIKSEFPIYKCKKCGKESIYYICKDCGGECEKLNFCPECKQKFSKEKCPEHSKALSYMSQRIDIKSYLDSARKKLNLDRSEIPPLIKGVRGTSNQGHVPEHLCKGILRSIFNLNVNKDGTIRYDATELPITHFKPIEVETSIEKLKELGYNKDIYGNDLKNEEQVLEILPHDVILPCCPDSLDEKADNVFMNVASFIDSLLVRFYGLKPFYNLKEREDLVGHLLGCMAPHNCAGVVGRIIGFSKTQSFLASPYMHAAMRRDCDGDEATMMLLLDMLVNFSREYLPAHRGGTQDAPLVLNVRISAGEVDDMIFNVDVVRELPNELYKAGRELKQPYEIKIEQIGDRLGGKEFKDLRYSYELSNFNSGTLCSSYKKLATMKEKVEKAMELVTKLRPADTSDVARLIIDRHFIRDIKGNLRKFSQQQFRCVKCNEKYRRVPLKGSCLKCGGKIIFTISKGSILKYMEPAMDLAENFSVPDYVFQDLELTKSYIESIFGREKEKQEALKKWF